MSAPETFPESQMLELESKLGVSFTNRNLLRQALTHESFVNEWVSVDTNREIRSYERLEYLGDAVLTYIVAKALFERSGAANEGELSMGRAHIVCKDSLSQAAKRLGLGDHILLGKGEAAYHSIPRDSVLEDTFEAIIGAVHEDQGFDATREFVFEHLGDQIEHVARNGVEKDPKSAFQELVQGSGLQTPRYETRSAGFNSDGQQIYFAKVFVEGSAIASGSGTSKSKAQKTAAERATESFAAGVPSKVAESAARRKRGTQTRGDDRVGTRRGSVQLSFKRVGGWLSQIGLRRSQVPKRRQLIFKRTD